LKGPRLRIFLSVAVGLVLFASGPAGAASPIPEPSINLGQSSFLDGEGGPGALLEIIGDGYGATRLNDEGGRHVPGHFEQTSGAAAIHLVYTSELQFLGANVGVETLLPLTYLHIEQAELRASTAGAGDLLIGTYLQWSHLSLFGRPFAMRLDMDVTAPTGPYAAGLSLNLGENNWQLFPHFAWTWRATDRWEISDRTTYNWSAQNDQPPSPLLAQFVQAGDQISNNLSASYALDRNWRIGLASYQLEQLRDTHVNGRPVPESRERVFGIGPGIYWTQGHVIVIADVYKEFAAQNRAEGYQGVLRLLMAF
jgi:hypothetical protein